MATNARINPASRLGRFSMSIKRSIARGLDKSLSKIFSLFQISTDLVLVEGNRAYDDNGRALFDWLIDKGFNKRYKFVWFMSNPEKYSFLEEIENVQVKRFCGVSDLLSHPLEYIEFMKLNCTAGLCLYSNSLLGKRTSPGQLRVFLSHGIALNKLDGHFGGDTKHDIICSTSQFSSSLILKALPRAKRIEVTGYPRNDLLFHKDARSSALLHGFQGMRRIIWMPTFKHKKQLSRRQNKGNQRNDFCVDRDNDISLLSESFMNELNMRLKRQNIVLFIKFHPFQDLSFISFVNMSNIVTISNDDLRQSGVHLYSFLGEFDALVTDYSSVAFDYMLLDRPIAYDLTDYDDYANGIGFSVANPQDYMPGHYIRTQTDFLEFVDLVAMGKDPRRDDRRAICEVFNEHSDDKSSERVLSLLPLTL